MPADVKGPALEARVARLLHAEGAFVRRAVDLTARFREHFQVTDIDVLAFSFDRTLAERVVNGECKTTEAKSAPSSGDRLLWLCGVAKLIDADQGFLATTKRANENTRALASRLGAEILDPSDLERREQLVGLTEKSPFGTHAPEVAAIATAVMKAIKNDEELRRVYAYVRSDLWLATPIAALKRAIGACRVLGSRYSDSLPEVERTNISWLMAEAITGITLALTRIASVAYRQPEDVFERYLHERLAEGVTSFAAMREMSKAIDKYLVGVLGELGVDPAKSAGVIGAFEPKPPAYADPLVELVQRLALSAPAAADLARLAEYHLLADLHASVRDAPVPAVNPAETSRLLRLVAAFLEGQANVPTKLLDPLKAKHSPPEPEEHAEPQRSSADGSAAEAEQLPGLFPAKD